MATYSQAGRPLAIQVSGLGPDDLLLEKVTGVESISQPFSFRLDLLATAEVDFDKVLGQKASVRISLPNGTRRTIHGIINRFIQAGSVPGPSGPSTFIRYGAELVPALWLLSQRVQSRVFQHRSTKDILRQVLATEWQLDVIINLVGTYEPRNFCVQYGESDLEFVNRIMEDEGISYYFTFDDDGHKLNLTDRASLFPDLAQPRTIAYDPAEGGWKGAPRIREWEKQQQLRPYRYSHRDYSFEVPDHPMTTEKHAGGTIAVGKVTHSLVHQREVNGVPMLAHYTFPSNVAPRYDSIDRHGGDAADDLLHIPPDQNRLNQVRLEEQLAQSLVVKGSGDCGHFLPGHKFQLDRHFNSTSLPGGDDTFLLTRVKTSVSIEGSYQSEDATETVYSNRFAGLPAGLPFQPPRVTPQPRIYGPETAVVIGPPGEDIHCDKFGRVKVRFRWDRDTGDKNDSSCWIRVSQPWAGQTWGALTLPRVGQEVVVAFEGGNPDRPLIQGSLYNAQQMPPYQLPDQRRQTGLVSSSGNGAEQYHELRFDDTAGRELLHMHSERDTNQESENDHRIQVGKDHGIEVGNDCNLKVHGAYNIHIAAGANSADGSGTGSFLDDLKKSLGYAFGGGVAPVVTRNVMNTFVDGSATTTTLGNAFFAVAGTREDLRLGAQLNFSFGAIANFTTCASILNVNIFGKIYNYTSGVEKVELSKVDEKRIKTGSTRNVNTDDSDCDIESLEVTEKKKQFVLSVLKNCAELQTVAQLNKSYNQTVLEVNMLKQQQEGNTELVQTGPKNFSTLASDVQTICEFLKTNVATSQEWKAVVLKSGSLIIT
jgi:type VI secretion system secreted protein VgrG